MEQQSASVNHSAGGSKERGTRPLNLDRVTKPGPNGYEKYFRILVQNSFDVIGILDSEGIVRYVSPAIQRILGVPPDEVIGKNAFEMVHPDDLFSMWIAFMQVIRGMNRHVPTEFRMRHADGSWVYVEALGNNLLDHPEIGGVVIDVRDITGRKRAEEQVLRHLANLSVLHTIDLTINKSFDLPLIFRTLLDQLVSQLGVDAADVLLLDAGCQDLKFAAGQGFRGQSVIQAPAHAGQGLAGKVVFERRIVHSPNLRLDTDLRFPQEMLQAEGIQSYTGAPLIAKGRLKGVVEIYHRGPFTPDQEWLDLLESISIQVAIAIDNAELLGNLQQLNTELTLAYDATLESWSRALDLRDRETEGHTQRVAKMTVQLAQAMGICDTELVDIRRGALLHDIGKIGIPDPILFKAGALTEAEWDVMRRHPTYAFEILSPNRFLKAALDIPYCHHERWDGAGYPRGLKGEQIPLAARIFAVVDVWDALCSDRPYRPAWPEPQVFEYIADQSGKHFDPLVVEVFLKMKKE